MKVVNQYVVRDITGGFRVIVETEDDGWFISTDFGYTEVNKNTAVNLIIRTNNNNTTNDAG